MPVTGSPERTPLAPSSCSRTVARAFRTGLAPNHRVRMAAWLGCLGLLAACGGQPPPRSALAPSQAASPGPESAGHLVVAIVVDQFAAWVAAERLPALPPTGGFARLLREGTYVRELRYDHAVTDTAPGHSALFTGAIPRESGVFANERLDATGKPVSILSDEATRVVDPHGAGAGVGSSLSILRVETVADRFRESFPNATVVGLSLKDRGALFGCGKRPDACLWYDRSRGSFVTSTAFSAHWPPRLPSVATDPLVRLPDRWELLDPAFVRAHAVTPDDQEGEGNLSGFGTTFPHPFSTSGDRAAVFKLFPYADEVLFELGLDRVDARTPDQPMLLVLSLSTNDYIGHAFGPHSWEAWDELSRLDAALGRFFSQLDARFGRSGWATILAADHGVTPMPESLSSPAARGHCAAREADPWRRPCEAGTRVDPVKLVQELRPAAERALGPGNWILGVSDPYVYFASDVRRGDLGRRARLSRAIVEALQARPEFAYARATLVTPPECPPDSDESIEALVCRSIPSDVPGDVYFALRPGSFIDPDVVPGKGTGHGSPHRFDRTVPLIVRSPGVVPEGVVIREATNFRAFARTLSSLLGIAPPRAAQPGRDLTRTVP